GVPALDACAAVLGDYVPRIAEPLVYFGNDLLVRLGDVYRFGPARKERREHERDGLPPWPLVLGYALELYRPGAVAEQESRLAAAELYAPLLAVGVDGDGLAVYTDHVLLRDEVLQVILHH